ncbi:MAG TPA: MoaD/ThiS family protein [Salinisphaeraceae bacterium]|nr:MoaD/ThiS family protein [Salinisphaeraceae bacterium]
MRSPACVSPRMPPTPRLNPEDEVSSTNEIVVECHGALSQLYGAQQIHVQLAADQLSVDGLFAALRQRNPDAAALLARSAVARGDALIAADASLAADDHVALIPPVSGG